MKLEDILEQDIKQAVKTLRRSKHKNRNQLRSDLNSAKKGNNPSTDKSPNTYYDGYGDDGDQALTNFQAGGK